MNRFVSTDGVHLSYYEWGTPNGSRPVVLHHGFAVDANANWVVPGVVDALVRPATTWWASTPVVTAAPTSRTTRPCTARTSWRAIFRPAGRAGIHRGRPDRLLDGRSRRRHHGHPRRPHPPPVLGGVGCAIVELGGVDRRVFEGISVVDVLLTEDPDEIAASLARPFRVLADAVGADRHALVAQLRAGASGADPARQHQRPHAGAGRPGRPVVDEAGTAGGGDPGRALPDRAGRPPERRADARVHLGDRRASSRRPRSRPPS